jgi:hypothetical protein
MCKNGHPRGTRAVLILTVAGAACLRAQTPETVAFVNVAVVPMDRERILTGQTVVVRGGRIAEIGAATSVRVPGDAVRIDGVNKYLMPGLTDAHFHLQADEDDRQLLQVLVANGVTSIFNLHGTPPSSTCARALRAALSWARRSTPADRTSPTPQGGSRTRTSRAARGGPETGGLRPD